MLHMLDDVLGDQVMKFLYSRCTVVMSSTAILTKSLVAMAL